MRSEEATVILEIIPAGVGGEWSYGPLIWSGGCRGVGRR